MLGSRSVAVHIFRGFLGFGLLAVALLYSSQLGLWTLLPIAGALVSFRGCPMCWTVGLIETIFLKKTGPGAASCVHGSCVGERPGAETEVNAAELH
jgi:hypothetical protein